VSQTIEARTLLTNHCLSTHRVDTARTGPRRARSPGKGRSHVSVTIKPLEDRIVVKPVELEQTTASGLVIPDTAKEKPQEGEVVSVGAGRFDDKGEKRIPLGISVGDKVLYSKYGGTEVKYDDTEYLVLSARDVLAVVTR